MSQPPLSANYIGSIPSLTALWVGVLLHFGKTARLAETIKLSSGNEKKQQDIAKLLETDGHRLIAQGGLYDFDDLRKSVSGLPILEMALAKALAKAMPEILDRRDYPRFLLNVDRAQNSDAFKGHLDNNLMFQAGQNMLDEGYPAYFQRLKRYAPDTPQMRELASKFEIIKIDDKRLPEPITVMFEKGQEPYAASVLAQVGSKGGFTPSDLIYYYETKGKPGEANVVERLLKQIMSLRLERRQTVIIDGQEKSVPTHEAPALSYGLKTLEL